MKIELRNVKHAKFASHETECFEASVYINGTRAGTVRNGGYGGSNEYHPSSLEELLNKHGKTLPPMVTEFPNPADPSKFWTLEYNADLIIGEAFDRWSHRERLMATLRDHVLFVDKDGQLMRTRKMPKEAIRRVMENPSLVPDARAILNCLSTEAALDLYMAHGK